MITWDDIEHFKPHETQCKCGCGRNEINMTSLKKLDMAREALGRKIILNRGYSCPEHDLVVRRIRGQIGNGNHPTGHAFDIKCYNSSYRWDLLGVLGCMFKRIGIYKTFLHVDDCPGKPEKVCWIG